MTISRPALVWRAPSRRGIAWWVAAAALFVVALGGVVVAAAWAVDAGWM